MTKRRNFSDKFKAAVALEAPRGDETVVVTSRTVVWLFVEQFWFEFVPVIHRLQGRLAAQV